MLERLHTRLIAWRHAGARLGRVGVLSLAGLVCFAVSAHAALVAIAVQQAQAPAAEPKPDGYETEDHFPGAALLYASEAQEDADAAPSHGVTGTAALPDMPIPADAQPPVARRPTAVG